MVTFENVEEAKHLARQVVTEAGEDYVYLPEEPEIGCVYFSSNNEPACLNGRILAKKGMTRRRLGVYNAGVSVGGLRAAGLIACDYRTVLFLGALQGQQDNKARWGDALEYALTQDQLTYA